MASGSKSSGREYSRNGPQEPELLALFLPQINNTTSQEEFHVFHETAEKKKIHTGPTLIVQFYLFPARERESLSLSSPHSVMFLKGFHVFLFVK